MKYKGFVVVNLMISLAILFALVGKGMVQGAPLGNIIHVSLNAEGANNGSSWADAYTDLQDALDAAQEGDEIWVAHGVYYPASNDLDKAVAFSLINDVGLFGGFDGTELQKDQRDWESNITVLSGDLDRNDETDQNGIVTDAEGIVGNNAYHVVIGEDIDNASVIDGFVITGGLAKKLDDLGGGGMLNRNSDPTLTNIIFIGNKTSGHSGGGMYNDDKSSPILTNVSFRNNIAGAIGGGVYNQGNVTLMDVNFSGNRATSGGGLFNLGNPKLTNVTFNGNQALVNGGGMYNSGGGSTELNNVTFTDNHAESGGGGLYNTDNESNPFLRNVSFRDNQADKNGGGMYNTKGSSSELINVIFTGNQAKNGGGMFNGSSTNSTLTNVTSSGNAAIVLGGGICNWDSSPVLINVTLSGNQADTGGGMHNDKEYHGSSPTLINTIFWGNNALTGPEINNETGSTPSVTYSLVQDGYPGEGNIDEEPLFVNPVPANMAPTSSGDYHLTDGSPAIDAGNNAVVTVDNDLDGNPRVVDGNMDGIPVVDMGAYEIQINDLTHYLTIEVSPIGGGETNPSVGVHSYDKGSVIDIVSIPALGYQFSHWSGACTGSGTCQVVMDADKSVKANFIEGEEMKIYLPMVSCND